MFLNAQPLGTLNCINVIRYVAGTLIQLGPGNETAAREALAAYPGGLQIGGGVNLDNAAGWLDAGASHVIITSGVFHEGRPDEERLSALTKAIGAERLVLISPVACAVAGTGW